MHKYPHAGRVRTVESTCFRRVVACSSSTLLYHVRVSQYFKHRQLHLWSMVWYNGLVVFTKLCSSQPNRVQTQISNGFVKQVGARFRTGHNNRQRNSVPHFVRILIGRLPISFWPQFSYDLLHDSDRTTRYYLPGSSLGLVYGLPSPRITRAFPFV